MKPALIFLLSLLAANHVYGQITTPGCTDLTVQQINLVPLTGQVEVTIQNDCDTCGSGILGCVYMELRIIRKVAPFDTIAASDCYCYISPNNNSQSTYAAQSSLTSLPPLHEIRVSLTCTGEGCDSIPFSAALLGSPSRAVTDRVAVSPNPVGEELSFRSTYSGLSTIRISDLQGRVFIEEKLRSGTEVVAVNHLPPGVYLLHVLDVDGHMISTQKITKHP